MKEDTILKRPITAEDLYEFLFVGDPRISPEGGRILFTVKSILKDRRKYRSQIWAAGLDGHERPFLKSESDDTMPRWSPDGRTVASVRTLDEISQILLTPADEGAPRVLALLPAGKIKSLDWAPDGQALAFTFHRAPQDAPPPKEQPVVRLVRRLRYREEGTGYWDGGRDHLWLVDTKYGQLHELTRGDFDVVHPTWSPDSSSLVFAANRHPEADLHLWHIDLWVVKVAGGEPRKIPKPTGPAWFPSWSPDGKWIAYLGHDRPEAFWGTANKHVWVVPASGDAPARDACEGFDRTCENVLVTDTKPSHGSPQGPVWSEDSRELYFVASDRGRSHLYRVPALGGRVMSVTHGQIEVMQFTMARGRFALSISDPLTLGEIHVLEGPTERQPSLRPVTAVNAALFGELSLSAPEEIEITGPDGTKIQGWILKPLAFNPRRKHPLVLQIHGGPRAMYGCAFFHEFQLLAAQGYVVLFTNPRGSQGHGEAFAQAIVNDWGHLDYRDLMASVDHALRTGYVDDKLMGVCGGSYGGYMTNWIIGHTDRFRAAITMRCVSNLYSMSGTSDIGCDDHLEFKTHPFEDPANYARLSPITYVREMKTPLLITHGESDLRCPIEQAEQLFTFLKLLRREVEFVRFPEENHDLSRSGRPDRRVARLKHIERWWHRWLK